MRTKGRVIGLNEDLMMVLCNVTGNAVVTASRVDGVWTISNDSTSRTADNRRDAIAVMVDVAKGLDSYYTAQVQPGLADQP
ncbi:hypothetical protein PXH78_27020 [Mycolicibacterium smegmatis]|uniref:hypothetical protein n=1 Tax=Mycolicibacterium smegmatis TaxID=1772 RepID=UPI0012FF800C|nr:hypothetical protein [Mycolicibacterium smegmatis]MDF1902765.1 hypothetical protein [Mycolicibacterium smegmatis]MDF1909041.1 hypothetical protein [Mycolicibacterium smegmatis]MDF1921260.1 hypothetical protein [Mycolicibacterium smegmatis]MDF1927525.1 hypothetical protein [Mycolicibacterium smegmatis]UAK53380.1 hypothetical protein K8P01_22580 [Mycolicibacterium smegmatis]